MQSIIYRNIQGKLMSTVSKEYSNILLKYRHVMPINKNLYDPEQNYLFEIKIIHPDDTNADQIFDEALKKIQAPEPDTEQQQPAQPYRYTLPTTNSLYTSFDTGEVIASSKEEARAKAIEELDKRFQDVNYWLSVHFFKQETKIFHNTDQLVIEEAHPDPDYADDDEPFNYKDYFHPLENLVLIYEVQCTSIDPSRINESDWKPKFYETHEEAKKDFNQFANIGYRLTIYKHIIYPDWQNLEPYSQCTDEKHLIHCAQAYNEHTSVVTDEINMTGRRIQDNAIIIVTDMDNNLVDIRPPFRHDLWESDLINDKDDCHYRHLLHHTADDTEAAIIEEIYDHFIAAYGGGDMTKEEWYVFINLMMIRNFYKD